METFDDTNPMAEKLTVFAPNNDAFTNVNKAELLKTFGTSDLSVIGADKNQTLLLLNYHLSQARQPL